MSPDSSRGISRRDFVRSAVAIGGTSALSACLQRERSLRTPEETDTDGPRFPRGNPEAMPAGQHRWSDYLVRDAHGNTVPPQHQVLLGLSYEGSTPPTDAQREQVETAFRTIERAFQWGTGGNQAVPFNRGLLFMLGYAPPYFDRVGDSPPSLMRPSTLLESVGEDPSKAADFDAMLLLTSDLGSVILAAEEALFGNAETVNGIAVEATLEGIFSTVERRTGVVGKGLPAAKLDEEGIPEAAPLSMGFKSGFADNLPSEDAMTLQEGPFAGGTTLSVSRLRIDLDRWYDQDLEERTAEMFCPAHEPEEIGRTGSGLGSDSGIDRSDVENIPEHAKKFDRLGHGQKTATARNEDFEPRILRRSEGVATDIPEGAAFNFSSVQRTFEAFVETRLAMNTAQYDLDVPDENHGIVDFLETASRSTYVLPTRERRALPVLGGTS